MEIGTTGIVVGRWWRDIKYISSVFLAFVAFTNFAYNNLGIKLTEFFTYTLDTFHIFLHSALNFLVFSWLSFLLQWLWFSLTWLASCVLPFIEPYFPQIAIPDWVSDLMLLSLAFSRAFDCAYFLVPRDERNASYLLTTPEMGREIEIAQGSLNWPHKITHWITTLTWKSVNLGTYVLTRRILGVALPASIVEGTLKSLAAMVFLWGFVRLVGYSINVGKAGHLDHIPLMRMRKRVAKYFSFSVLAALAAAGIFLYLNGLWVEFKYPPVQ